MFGAKGPESRLAELASAQCLVRDTWTCWMCNGELCKEQREIQTGMVASYLLQPSPGVNICKGRFPQLDNAMTAMKFFSLGKRIKVKQLNVQLWCTTDPGITLEV